MFHPVKRTKRAVRRALRSINTTTRKVVVAVALLSGTSSPLAAAQVAPDTLVGQFGSGLISLVTEAR